jgi:hypothetical protein
MVQITNVYERAIALLISQFKEQPNFNKLFLALSTTFQTIENTLWQLKTLRWLTTAQGVQLDELGEIVGLSRSSGQSDESYREALIFQSYINSSQGTAEECLNALQFFTQASKVWYFNMFPAGFKLATDGLTFPSNKLDLVSGLNKIKAAGVESIPIILTFGLKPFELVEIVVDPFYVNPNPLDSSQFNPLDVNSQQLFVNAGSTSQPLFGGQLAYFGSDGNLVTSGAGRLCGLLQI